MVLESEERRLVLGRDQPDVAAVAAVAAVGPAPVDVRLAPPRHRAGPAVARARVQLGLIHEAGHGEKDYEPSNRRARWATSARARSSSMCVQRPASTTHEPPTHTSVTK